MVNYSEVRLTDEKKGTYRCENCGSHFYNRFRDDNFKAENNGEISLWNFYNLITGAPKNSYIDSFLSRSASATETVLGISAALRNEDSGYKWFLG